MNRSFCLSSTNSKHVSLQLSAALERVRAGADVMPKKQLEKVLTDELGAQWRAKVANFEDEPLAAASIGQVSSTSRPKVSSACRQISQLDSLATTLAQI